MYKIKEVGLFDFSGQIRVNSILYNCGKDMAKKIRFTSLGQFTF